MRRKVRMFVLPTMTAVVMIVPVSTAHAANTSAVCPAQGSVSSFGIDRYVLLDKTVTVPVPDGTELPGGFIAHNSGLPAAPGATHTTGRFVIKFANDSTHFSITSTESGPTWTTDDLTPTPGAAASFTEVLTGNNANLFGPKSEAALAAKGIDVPTLAYTSGLLILHVVVPADGTQPFVDNFSLNGKLVDGCALLAAGA